jgi:hypothetical protein
MSMGPCGVVIYKVMRIFRSGFCTASSAKTAELCISQLLCNCLVFLERLHHRPILTEAPKNSTVVVGHNKSFRCEVLSDLHPHVEWFRGYYTSLNETDTNTVVKVHQPDLLMGAACCMSVVACDVYQY